MSKVADRPTADRLKSSAYTTAAASVREGDTKPSAPLRRFESLSTKHAIKMMY